jgi:hypothetical protein
MLDLEKQGQQQHQIVERKQAQAALEIERLQGRAGIDLARLGFLPEPEEGFGGEIAAEHQKEAGAKAGEEKRVIPEMMDHDDADGKGPERVELGKAARGSSGGIEGGVQTGIHHAGRGSPILLSRIKIKPRVAKVFLRAMNLVEEMIASRKETKMA